MYELRWTAPARWVDQYGQPCEEDRTHVVQTIEREATALLAFYAELERMGHACPPGRSYESIGKARETSVASLNIIGRGCLSLVETDTRSELAPTSLADRLRAVADEMTGDVGALELAPDDFADVLREVADEMDDGAEDGSTSVALLAVLLLAAVPVGLVAVFVASLLGALAGVS